MTENELIDFLEDEISGLKDQRDGVIGEIAAEVFLEINGKERISKLRAIIGLITEIKQYRELGTVEELKNQKHNLSIAYKIISDYQNIGTVEDLKQMKENGAFSTKELLIIRYQQMELEKYKEIGTVKLFSALKHQFTPHQIDKTSCKKRMCNKCDMFRKENEKYHEIGTVEEVREAAEKTKPKKCVEDSCPDHTHYKCPTCGKIQKTEYEGQTFGCILNNCSNCGQRLEK